MESEGGAGGGAESSEDEDGEELVRARGGLGARACAWAERTCVRACTARFRSTHARVLAPCHAAPPHHAPCNTMPRNAALQVRYWGPLGAPEAAAAEADEAQRRLLLFGGTLQVRVPALSLPPPLARHCAPAAAVGGGPPLPQATAGGRPLQLSELSLG